ncbi:MAG: hypothetical protein ACTSRP_25910, partial [Candidatus Helarchaeota archaeon]
MCNNYFLIFMIISMLLHSFIFAQSDEERMSNITISQRCKINAKDPMFILPIMSSPTNPPEPIKEGAQIRIPYTKCIIRGEITVIGTANINNFGKYILDYRNIEATNSWNIITEGKTPIINNILGIWDVGYKFEGCGGRKLDYPGLNGEYTLRLRVFDKYSKLIASDKIIVKVGRVISSDKSEEVVSPDNKFRLIVPPHSVIMSDGLPLSVIDIETNLSSTNGLYLVSKLYEVEQLPIIFDIPAELTIDYNETLIENIPKYKLAIYRCKKDELNWEFVGNKNILNGSISTKINILGSDFSPYYYAIFAKIFPPQPVYIKPMPQITSKHFIYIIGKANNEFTYLTIKVNNMTNYKSIPLYPLQEFRKLIKIFPGKNEIIIYTIDHALNYTASTQNVILVDNQPQDVYSVLVDYITNEKKIKIQIEGKDINNHTQDVVVVKVKSSITDPNGIQIQLLETSTNSGIYIGRVFIGKESYELGNIIGCRRDGEIIEIVPVTAPLKRESIVYKDILSPFPPFIWSTENFAKCESFFQRDKDGWTNRGGILGAIVERKRDENNYYVKIYNRYNMIIKEFLKNRRHSSVYVLKTPYSAKEYPIIQFDYKISPYFHSNFLFKVNGEWKNVIFTDPENIVYPPIGKIPGI